MNLKYIDFCLNGKCKPATDDTMQGLSFVCRWIFQNFESFHMQVKFSKVSRNNLTDFNVSAYITKNIKIFEQMFDTFLSYVKWIPIGNDFVSLQLFTHRNMKYHKSPQNKLPCLVMWYYLENVSMESLQKWGNK